MEFQFNFYVLLVLIGAITSTVVGVVSWHSRPDKVINQAFAGLMLTLAAWAYMHTIEQSLLDVRLKAIVLDLQYIPIVLFVPAWLIFALAYTNRAHLLTRRKLLLLMIHPTAVLLLVLTNPHHHLFRVTITFDFSEATRRAIVQYGPFFWLHVLYSYSLIFVGAVLVVRTTLHYPAFYRRQVGIISVSIFLPWILNALYLLGLTPMDYTMLGLTTAGLALAWGLWRLDLLDIIPMARRAVFDSLKDALFTLDENGNIVDFNPAAHQLLPDPTQAIGRPFQTVFADQPGLLQALANIDQAVSQVVQVDSPKLAFYDLSAAPVFGQQAQPKGHVLVVRDVTDRKLAEHAEHEQRLLAEALRDVAMLLNYSLDQNEVMDRILASVGRVLPHDVANIMLLEDNIAHFVRFRTSAPQDLKHVEFEWVVADTPTLAAMMATKRPFVIPDVSQSQDWRRKPGTDWIRAYAGAPIQQDGKVIGFINLDSSTPNAYRPADGERLQAFANQAAAALRNAQLYAQLAERNQELDAYARTIAHDLKSPLGLIYGYVELMAEHDLPPMAQGYLDIIRATIGRMEEMTEQLLLLAQLRDVNKTAVSVAILPLIYDVISRFSNLIETRKITIRLSEPLLSVQGHSPWLEEVFANLVGNAIKYIGHDNPQPTIHIRCLYADEMVRYEIEDNGLGIPPDKQDKIFEMFTRFHPAEGAGTGLGLPIVERIIHKMGGQVGVCSTPGVGSTFWFTLPAG